MSHSLIRDAIEWRAEAFRRWRDAATTAPAGRTRRVYEALADFECARFDQLVKRYFGTGDPRLPVPEPSAPTLSLPRGSAGQSPMRAAKVAAEAERRRLAALLRRTSPLAPQRDLLIDLMEDARRVRDQFVAGEHRRNGNGSPLPVRPGRRLS